MESSASGRQLTVHGVELDFADKVNALLLAAGLGALLFALTALVLGGRETET